MGVTHLCNSGALGGSTPPPQMLAGDLLRSPLAPISLSRPVSEVAAILSCVHMGSAIVLGPPLCLALPLCRSLSAGLCLLARPHEMGRLKASSLHEEDIACPMLCSYLREQELSWS